MVFIWRDLIVSNINTQIKSGAVFILAKIWDSDVFIEKIIQEENICDALLCHIGTFNDNQDKGFLSWAVLISQILCFPHPKPAHLFYECGILNFIIENWECKDHGVHIELLLMCQNILTTDDILYEKVTNDIDILGMS